jgi:hypothetical protein
MEHGEQLSSTLICSVMTERNTRKFFQRKEDNEIACERSCIGIHSCQVCSWC